MNRRQFLSVIGAGSSLSLLGSGAVSATPQSRTAAQEGGATTPYEPLGTVDLHSAYEAAVHDDGDVAYVATGDGFASVDISDPENPTILAKRQNIEAPDGREMGVVYDLWPADDRLVVVGPAQPAPGFAQGFALFDISDPGEPEQVAWHSTEHYIHNSFFVDGTVYLTGSSLPTNPLVVVGVGDDDPEELGRWSVVNHEPDWRETALSGRVLHDVYVQDEIAYLPFWDAGTWIVDVSDPTDPTVRSRVGDFSVDELQAFSVSEARLEAFIPPGNAHYAQVDEEANILAVGKEAWAAQRSQTEAETIGGPGGIDLWDISDKDSPEQLTQIEAPESFDNTQSGWFTTAHNCDIVDERLYASWYFGGVTVHDISDPANPERILWWRDPHEASFWTAQSAVPGETFLASSSNLGSMFDTPNETSAALYLFPDEAGEQADPPDLTVGPADSVAQGGTPTPTPEPTATPGPTPTPTPTATATPSQTSTPTAGDPTADSDDEGPGFGVPGAIAGLGSLAFALARRYDGDSTDE